MNCLWFLHQLIDVHIIHQPDGAQMQRRHMYYQEDTIQYSARYQYNTIRQVSYTFSRDYSLLNKSSTSCLAHLLIGRCMVINAMGKTRRVAAFGFYLRVGIECIRTP